jgi:hypothetical protein
MPGRVALHLPHWRMGRAAQCFHGCLHVQDSRNRIMPVSRGKLCQEEHISPGEQGNREGHDRESTFHMHRSLDAADIAHAIC